MGNLTHERLSSDPRSECSWPAPPRPGERSSTRKCACLGAWTGCIRAISTPPGRTGTGTCPEVIDETNRDAGPPWQCARPAAAVAELLPDSVLSQRCTSAGRRRYIERFAIRRKAGETIRVHQDTGGGSPAPA
jgi:hypothetical protein